MGLWNIIRDFFVKYLFGGMTSEGELISDNVVGLTGNNTTNTANTYLENNIGVTGEGTPLLISIGDWLSTTATIITLILLLIGLVFVFKKIFALFAGLVRSW